MAGVRIAALEAELPAERLDDEALVALLSCAAETVTGFSRGRTRHSAPDGEGPAALAAPAARRALASLDAGVDSIDMLVFATATPDMWFPGGACILQGLIDAPTVGCLDVRSQCTGFLVALDVARKFVGNGTFERVLVAAGDVPSHIVRLDGTDPELACLTGDAAAVASVEPGNGSGEVLSVEVETDGARYRELWSQYPHSRAYKERPGVVPANRLSKEALASGDVYPRADFPGLRATACAETPRIFDRALAEAGLESVEATIIAHVDPDVEAEIGAALGARAGRLIEADTVYSFGATLPLRLARARAAGEVAEGQTVALVTSGSGASWGAAVIRV